MKLARVSIAVIVIALSNLVTTTPAKAAPSIQIVGDYEFSYDETNVTAGATITDYVGTEIDLILPTSVEIDSVLYDITAIGPSAFCAKGLWSVTIPDSIADIGYHAFSNNYLKSVSIPDSVVTIEDHAFHFNNLMYVTIPDSVIAIGNYAFDGNTLRKLTIPDSVTTIGDHAFEFNDLRSVIIPDSVTAIGNYAFAFNDLTSVTIGASVTTIGDYAFDHNPLLEVVMTGPAPWIASSSPFGRGGEAPVILYDQRFSSSGYNAPTWTFGGETYVSRAIGSDTEADVGLYIAGGIVLALAGAGYLVYRRLKRT